MASLWFVCRAAVAPQSRFFAPRTVRSVCQYLRPPVANSHATHRRDLVVALNPSRTCSYVFCVAPWSATDAIVGSGPGRISYSFPTGGVFTLCSADSVIADPSRPMRAAAIPPGSPRDHGASNVPQIAPRSARGSALTPLARSTTAGGRRPPASWANAVGIGGGHPKGRNEVEHPLRSSGVGATGMSNVLEVSDVANSKSSGGPLEGTPHRSGKGATARSGLVEAIDAAPNRARANRRWKQGRPGRAGQRRQTRYPKLYGHSVKAAGSVRNTLFLPSEISRPPRPRT